MVYRFSTTSYVDMGDVMGGKSGVRDSDSLRVLQVLVGVVVVVLAVMACAVLVGAVAGSGTVPGLDTKVCVATAPDEPGSGRPSGMPPGPRRPTERITRSVEEVQVCDHDPDGATRAIAGVGLAVGILAPLLFFGLLWRLLRRARREGVFADRVPAGLRLLGGLLLVWAALGFVVNGFVAAALLTRMTDSVVLFKVDVSLTLVLPGVALLALAQVMAQAVDMRHDVEATI
jgi:hypothetical protein